MAKSNVTEPAHSLLYNPLILSPSTHIKVDTDNIITQAQRSTDNDYNLEQKEAISASFKERVFLLWGPPGTGKTATLAGIMLSWVENAQLNNLPCSIAVGSSNWTAIDNLLKAFAKLLVKRREAIGVFPLAVDILRVSSNSGEKLNHSTILDIDVSSSEASQLKLDLNAPSNCLIVGSTWKQFYNLGLKDNTANEWFDLLLIDEASQVKVNQAASYFLLLKKTANVVIAGDDKQLGPIYGYDIEDKAEGLFDCIYTYMKLANKVPVKTIVNNYRSNDTINTWPSERFYENKLNSINSSRKLDIGIVTSKPINWPDSLFWSDEFINIINADTPIVVIVYPADIYTVFNPFEAQVTASLTFLLSTCFQLKGISEQDFYEKHFGVVTPHRAQRSNIQHEITKFANLSGDDIDIVDTVDRFQGQEREVILASYTVSDRDFVRSEEDFILDARRFNVSLTRAQSKFIMIISEAIVQHLPSEMEVAVNASHLQLFVQDFCKTSKNVTLAYYDLEGQRREVNCLIKIP